MFLDPMSNTLAHAIAMLWVGGFGLLFFAFPETACRVFRVQNPTPRSFRAVKIFGGIAILSVLVGALVYAIWAFDP
jgi:hypothetical protein